ncbi:MAG: hypothetical protein R6X32_09185 [Chloroflexota bacterium]
MMPPSAQNGRFLLSGVIAGAASTFVFTAIHHLFISNIWFSLLPMLIAGALCGLCLAWSYGRLFQPPSIPTWLLYNLVYIALFFLLGILSILIFEPIATIPQLVVANEPPDELIRQAMPLTLGFILGSAALMTILWGRNLVDIAAILLTCTVLIILLGLNVSVLGLVYIPGSAISLVAKMFGLIVLLNLVYLAIFLLLEREIYLRRYSGWLGIQGVDKP